MTEQPAKLLLSALDVAAILRLDADFPDDNKAQIDAVHRLHRGNKLRGIKGVGKALKFRPADVRAFIDSLSPGDSG